MTPSDENMVLTHIEAGVLTITLNRPDRLNSFNDEMHRQLSEALNIAERDEAVRCVLFTGAGRGFCAGAAIALACDIVIASANANFIQSFCRLGLVPDSGGSWFLPRLAGHARAMGMALLGDKISAHQALEWGMIWQVVEPEMLASRTQELAQHLATQPTYGLGLIKKAMYSATTNTLDQQLDLERDLQRLGGRSEDYREGVSAFFQKRQPEFKGK